MRSFGADRQTNKKTVILLFYYKDKITLSYFSPINNYTLFANVSETHTCQILMMLIKYLLHIYSVKYLGNLGIIFQNGFETDKYPLV